jgi:hypothetical protein
LQRYVAVDDCVVKIKHVVPLVVLLPPTHLASKQRVSTLSHTDKTSIFEISESIHQTVSAEAVQFSGTVNLSGFYNTHFQIVQVFCIPATNAFLSDLRGRSHP